MTAFSPGGPAQTSAKASLCELKNPGNRVSFHFNPNEISFSRTAEYNSDTHQGKKHPTIQFKGTGPTDLSLALLFDAAEKSGGSVLGEVEQLLKWTQPAEDTPKNPKPPLLKFSWGSLVIGDQPAFTGVLKKVDVKYTLFTRSGTPIRANVTISLAAMPNESPSAGATPQRDTGRQNPSSGGSGAFRTHVVNAGESLHALAFRYYDNPNHWRGLARANSLDDPLRIRPGSTLLIPAVANLPDGD